MIDQDVVDRFHLSTFDHPIPYQLNWPTSAGNLMVQKQARVEFSIGEYKDAVLCDVVSLEVCHLLLGRPWQFDRKAIHDGFTNQICFNLTGRRVTLFPLTPRECLQDHVEREQ